MGKKLVNLITCAVMVKRERTEQQTMIYKVLRRKLKIKQQKPHLQVELWGLGLLTIKSCY